MSRAHRISLKRSLGLGEATFYGIGIIIGAGIYAIIGAGAGIAGNGLWLSFAIAAVIAGLTGLSYAELSSRLPKEAAEYHYTKRAFDKSTLAFSVGWVMIIANLIATATVSLGFAGYFSSLFNTPLVPVAAVLVLIMGAINFIGIKESAKFNIIATLIEAGGLVVVIALATPLLGTADFSIPAASWSGILPGAALIFFAFLGFEDVANISEETKNARKVIPKALLIALAVSTLLYILTSLSALALIGAPALAASPAPLSDAVAAAAGPSAAGILSIIALFATFNTALFLLIVSSRMLYGIAAGGDLPARLA
ncbi:MAG TPA: APC family permease, partial [archaeon]|nr:APC family permease [archaeon]